MTRIAGYVGRMLVVMSFPVRCSPSFPVRALAPNRATDSPPPGSP